MPNWCTNSLNIKHNDSAMIDRIVNIIEDDKGLFNSFTPYPEKYAKLDREAKEHLEKTKEYITDGYNQGGYQWCCNNWGTKWDVHYSDIQYGTKSPNEIQLYFVTAWCPPIQFYETLEDLEYKVRATFDEEGHDFLGIYEDGIEEVYDYPETMKAFNKLPKSIQKEFSFIKNELVLSEREREKENEK